MCRNVTNSDGLSWNSKHELNGFLHSKYSRPQDKTCDEIKVLYPVVVRLTISL